MNLSDNGQRSVSSQSPPVTPQRRFPFAPNHNPACRPNGAPLRREHAPRRSQQNTATPPPGHSLAHANARLVQERLQQYHNRLQVQLHARPLPPSVPAGPVKVFLDTTFRAYASRIQTEFNSLRAACARAVQREQHQAAEMRGTCARLAHERDVAEEKLRVLLDRRARAGKRTRAQVEEEEAELDAMRLMYPPSPVSPPQMPTQSPPPRLLSPFVLAARRSPSHTPDPEDKTGFDLTVACDSLPRPSKKRRVSDSSERTLVATRSPSPHSGKDVTTTKERETCPPAPETGECDMDLETDSESEGESETDAGVSSKSRSQSSSRAASHSLPADVERAVKSEPSPSPPPPASSHKACLDLEYVDIMYMPTEGKLVCRVCLCVPPSLLSFSTHVSFP
ncbi:hypothetical protein DFH09DRAFT_331915 [Mycena vulgaris]|nr:hypothetical protein DFH09DRAFT_331915 [Mycena vulgaris]